MEAAVTLAADLEAELQGLYFENDSLLRAAELPFVQEVTKGSGTVRSIDARSLERAMRNRANHAGMILQRWAESAHIPCSFEVTREKTRRQELLASSESDIVFFGAHSHAPAVRPPMGLRTARIARPLLLLIDDSPRCERALATAAAVAGNRNYPIILLVLARDRAHFDKLSSATSDKLCRWEQPHTLLPHPVSNSSALIQMVRCQRPHLLVLNRQCEIITAQTVDAILDQVACPIVLV